MMFGDIMAEKEKLKVFGFESKDYPELDGKCIECNNEADVLYVIAKDEKEAKTLLKKGKDGVCGECLGARLIEMTQDEYFITK